MTCPSLEFFPCVDQGLYGSGIYLGTTERYESANGAMRKVDDIAYMEEKSRTTARRGGIDAFRSALGSLPSRRHGSFHGRSDNKTFRMSWPLFVFPFAQDTSVVLKTHELG